MTGNPTGRQRQASLANALLRQQHRCYWCGARLGARLAATRDHLLPTQAGGTHRAENIVASCGPCNEVRSNPRRIAGASSPGRRWGNFGAQENVPEVFIPTFAVLETLRRGILGNPRPGVVVRVGGCGHPVHGHGPCLSPSPCPDHHPTTLAGLAALRSALGLLQPVP